MLACIIPVMLMMGDSSGEMKRLEGVWTVSSMEQNGRPFPPELTQSIRLEIEGDRFTFINGKSKFTAKITKLETESDPRAIDLERESDKQALKGIYKLEGDTLFICTAARGNRPRGFFTEVGRPNVLSVYKRTSPSP